jgi:hypothetical protein
MSANEKANTEKQESLGSQSLRENTKEAGINSSENINAKLANPLSGLTHEELMADGKKFALEHGLEDLVVEFQKGALIAQDPTAFESLPLLDDDDKRALSREITNKWDQVCPAVATKEMQILIYALFALAQDVILSRCFMLSGCCGSGCECILFSKVVASQLIRKHRWTNL